ncbi:hypothetical protein [Streptomyces sp. WMMB 322]|uniref:hypothetical protein n=1 Tax=Streptomyces sp. WMMB 322 TaxID=1286821 RepID=UPI000823E3CA|nr:hypothetical protein [Streptomyces sp. WMMB 322]SCK27179.1 hypothetical protein H180DRAFT_02099 [Streptomyces sp. WMMB 322]
MKIRKSLAVLGASAALALGFGGVMAPSAQAHTPSPVWDRATYTQADPHTGVMRAGSAVSMPGGASAVEPNSAASLHCWNTYVSGRASVVSCSGLRWRAYVDCTDGRRYVTPSAMSDARRVVVYCPRGTRALSGGAYGR